MLFHHGVAMMAAMRILLPVVHRAVARRLFPDESARLQPALIPAAPFVSPLHLLVLPGSSRLMAVARAGARLPLPARWIRQGQWRMMCAIVQSCWKRWPALIPRI